jgi:hypothetical protein
VRLVNQQAFVVDVVVSVDGDGDVNVAVGDTEIDPVESSTATCRRTHDNVNVNDVTTSRTNLWADVLSA